jgi:hypothetical protein
MKWLRNQIIGEGVQLQMLTSALIDRVEKPSEN